ncbi:MULTISPECIES: BTAD domain-containing putative transcriptional regulator [unclassified Streptomyces]|uniref:AfsR/SARP family transcriptional regulator n=1 Tax=unclassified Streptomyces TaxID=2593676 RepID=UPI0033B512FD|nr:tetratricopeptide repeat protein [Streptomyces sp. NBC_01176]WSS89382.1 tetratricopeptide repeat protein [Streptomyces sp. NBC_01176]
MGAGFDTRLRFNLFGPLEAWVGDERLRLGGLIQERVLATLLLEPGKVLPVTRLVAAAWAEDPPATSSHQVRKAVADLRRRIPGGGEILLTDGPGYRAELAPGQLDLTEFNALVTRAREDVAAGRRTEAASALGDALALWRGPVLAGDGGPVIEAAATALEERRLAATEQFFGLRLDLGEGSELVVDLRETVAQYPLRETLRGQLMLALYRSERQAEALEEYSRTRELLVEELGIDPGPRLTKLYEDILRESPELSASPSASPAPAPAAPAVVESPCTLPYDVSDFSGRESELGQILAQARQQGGAGTRIVAIDGMGGSGKTSLAVRAAHRLADSFPDGQLHIDLRAYSPDQQLVSTVSALGTLLRALGLPDARIPDDLAGRTALWRTLLVGKRMLILLDNASDAAAVRPLLPTDPGCLVLVTSRARLIDLDGAHWLTLDVMTPAESRTLMAQILGEARVAAEPEGAAELARLCDHLPLALRIATARLGNRPRWTLQYMADRLRDETRRLDELSIGVRSVAATLRLSYQALDEESRTTFRTLALHPGGGIDVYAAGALLGTWPRHGEDVLERLLDVHLVEQPEIGRYTFHDLVGSFARGLHGGALPPAHEAAVDQLLGYYLTATEVACKALFPGRRDIPSGLPASTFELPYLKTAEHAGEWFAREQITLMSVVRLAVRHGYDRHAVCLARNVVFHLNAHGLLDEFGELARTAVAAARRLGDDALLGVSLANLGVACWELGRFTEGVEVAREGRDLAARLGDLATKAHSDSTLGLYESLLGRFSEALAHLEQAITTERELGLHRAEAESLTILSTLYEQWGRYQEAVEAAHRAVELCGRVGQHENGLVALIDLGFAYVGLGEYAKAEAAVARAREICDDTREPGIAALVLALSADTAHALGDTERSAEYARRSLRTVESSASPIRSAKVRNVIGRVLHKHGEHQEALSLHVQAHELASRLQYLPEDAYARLGMARAAEALGDHRAATAHRVACDELFTSMGVPCDRWRR